MGIFDRFDKTKLPLQDGFFSKLTGSPCLDSEYTHATQVWIYDNCRLPRHLLAVGCVADIF